MFDNGFMDRLKHGVGVEGAGTCRYGPRGTPNFPHYVSVTEKWVIKVILYFTYVGQCPFARVFEWLLGP